MVWKQTQKLKSCEMKDWWMKSDDGLKKKDEWWRMNEEGWCFQAAKGF